MKNVQCGEELEMSWRRRCLDISQLYCTDDDCVDDDITVEDRSSSQTGKSVVRHTSEVDGAETFTLLQRMLQKKCYEYF